MTAKQPISCNGWSRGARSVRIFSRLIWSRDEIQFIRLILSNFGGGWPTSGRLSSPPPLVASDEGKVIFISKVVTRHFHALERHVTPMKGGHPRRTNMLMRVSFKFPFFFWQVSRLSGVCVQGKDDLCLIPLEMVFLGKEEVWEGNKVAALPPNEWAFVRCRPADGWPLN